MRWSALAGVLVTGTLTACGETSGPSAEPSATAGARSLEADLSAYCGAVCKRSTACGIEAADAIVRGNPAEVSLLSRLKADASKNEATCSDACRASPPTDEQASAFAKAQTCVEQSTCDALEACLTASAR